jgi:hypothetical protein
MSVVGLLFILTLCVYPFILPIGQKKEVTLNGLIIRTSTPFLLLFIVLHGLIRKHRTANSGLSCHYVGQ